MKTKILLEISSNWHSFQELEDSCKWARDHGCVPKLQSFRADWLVNRKRHPKMYDTLKRYEISNDWMERLRKYKPVYSVFDVNTVKYMEANYLVSDYKIASPDCVFRPLVEAVGATNRHTYMSVGGATLDEIRQSVQWFNNVFKLTLMHCVVEYPARDMQLWYMRDRIVGSKLIPWGISIHNPDPLVGALAVAIGADAVEYHFKLRDIRTPDSGHSLDPKGMRLALDYIERCEKNLGNFERPTEAEKVVLKLARRKGDGRR